MSFPLSRNHLSELLSSADVQTLERALQRARATEAAAATGETTTETAHGINVIADTADTAQGNNVLDSFWANDASAAMTMETPAAMSATTTETPVFTEAANITFQDEVFASSLLQDPTSQIAMNQDQLESKTTSAPNNQDFHSLFSEPPPLNVLEKYGISSFQELTMPIGCKDIFKVSATLNWLQHRTFLVADRNHSPKAASYTCRSCKCQCKFRATTDSSMYVLVMAPSHSPQCIPETHLFHTNAPKRTPGVIFRQLPITADAASKLGSLSKGQIKEQLEKEHPELGTIPISTLYDHLDDIKLSVIQSRLGAYSRLGVWMAAFVEKNPGTTAVIQNDSEGRFFRALLIPGQIFQLFRQGIMLPVFFFDVAHSKELFYDGVFASICFRTGTGQTIPGVLAVTPIEDTNNVSWTVSLTIMSGIPLHEMPGFVDRISQYGTNSTNIPPIPPSLHPRRRP